MSKIALIFQREYLTRVRKKSFIVMTLLAPVLLAAVFAIPLLLASGDDDTITVRVLDEAGLVLPGLRAEPDPGSFRFEAATGSLPAAQAALKGHKNTVLLVVPAAIDPAQPTGVHLYTATTLGLGQPQRLEGMVRRQLEVQRLRRAGVAPEVVHPTHAVPFELVTSRLDRTDATDDGMAWILGYGGGFLIYMFIFIYGIQVMRGIIEEKTNRIVEVVISSVKPFELMMGKVLGIAAVGLTQFVLWVILSTTATSAVSSAFGLEKVALAKPSTEMRGPGVAAAAPTDAPADTPAKPALDPKKQATAELLGAFKSQNWPLLLAVFLFYFLGGYLLYAALFGAVGAAVDAETDAQQFMLPITLPLVLTFVVAQTVIIRNPDGPVAVWMSLIPFTSPIAMVLRLPFGGVPGWQLALSMALLVLGFVGTIWLAGRIYRIGILMYGKKPTYRELSKWLFYKG